jgi:hypothetical protein
VEVFEEEEEVDSAAEEEVVAVEADMADEEAMEVALEAEDLFAEEDTTRLHIDNFIE